MRRLASLTLLTATLGAVAVAPASQAKVTVGISDQQASTFSNPLFNGLKMKTARYVAPYDVMFDTLQHERWDAWYKAAKADGQKILVSFEHSRTAGKERKTPSATEYDAAMKEFSAAYPGIEAVNTWNEVNACQRAGETERQPAGICKASKVKTLISFYAVSRKYFSGKTIIPVDVLDDRSESASSAVKYIKAFKKASKTQPKVWGVHNYSDTNRKTQVRTKKILKAIGSKGQVWLLETGGQLNVFKGSQSTKEKGAAKALGCMFYIAKSHSQIKRLYVYQFNGAAAGASFDAGLIDANGKKRAGYTTVKSRKSSKC